MQKSPLLVIAAITLIIGSILTLVAGLFIIPFTYSDYFMPYHYGTRVIDIPFFVRLSIIGFDLFASIFGLISAIQVIRGKGLKSSILAGTFLLIAGLLFFVSSLVHFLLPNLMDFTIIAWWWLLQGFFGFPIVFVAALALVFITREKRSTQSTKRSNLLLIAGSLMVLCSIQAAFFAFMSYSPTWTYPYETALQDPGFLTPIYSWILSACTIILALGAGILLLLRRFTGLAITLTELTLLSSILLSAVFISTIYYNLIWSWFGGPLFEYPTILLSSITLILAIYSRKTSQVAPGQKINPA